VKRTLRIALSIIFLLTIVMPTGIFADNATPRKVNDPNAVGTINDGNVKITINDLYILEVNNSKRVSFTVEFFNSGKTDVDVIDYWFKVRTTNGSSHSVQLLSLDKEKSKITSNTYEQYTFSATVSKSVTLNQLIIDVVKWDLKSASLEKSLGKITVPSTYTFESTEKMVRVKNATVKTIVSDLNLNESDDLIDANIELSFDNQGSSGITLPEYKYYIQTTEGYLYPLTSTEASNVLVQPKMIKKIELDGSFPAKIDKNKLSVVITQMDNNQEIPIVIISVPKVFENEEETPLEQTESKVYSNKNGKYNIKIESVQRIPSGDEDIIAANISVTNESGKTIPKLNLTGTMELDGIKIEKEKTNAVLLDQVLQLTDKKTVHYVLYARIPYTYDFSKVKIYTQEQESEKSTKTIAAFEKNASQFYIPTASDKLVTSTTGQQTGIAVKTVNTFEGQTTNIYYLQVEIENLEKRPVKKANYVGYLKTSNDVYFPVQTEEYANSILPNGKILLNMWVMLPNNYKMSDFRLVLGEERGDQNNKAIVNAYSLKIPTEMTEVEIPSSNSTELSLYPYKLKINNIIGAIDMSLTSSTEYEVLKRKIRFNYELVKELYYENAIQSKKIIVEVKSGNASFSKVLEVNKDFLDNEMSNYLEFVLEEKDSYSGNMYGDTLQVTIYEQFEGHKKKLVFWDRMRWIENRVY